MNRWIRLGEQFTRCADDRPGVERDADDRVVTGGREVWRMPSSSQHTVNPPSRASHQAQRSRRPDCVLIGRLLRVVRVWVISAMPASVTRCAVCCLARHGRWPRSAAGRSGAGRAGLRMGPARTGPGCRAERRMRVLTPWVPWACVPGRDAPGSGSHRCRALGLLGRAGARGASGARPRYVVAAPAEMFGLCWSAGQGQPEGGQGSRRPAPRIARRRQPISDPGQRRQALLRL